MRAWRAGNLSVLIDEMAMATLDCRSKPAMPNLGDFGQIQLKEQTMEYFDSDKTSVRVKLEVYCALHQHIDRKCTARHPRCQERDMFKRNREQDSFTSHHEYVETDTSPRKWFGFSLKRKSGVASDERGQHSSDPDFYRREYYKQGLDIQDLQQQLMARDADYEDLQQQWNLQNFKFCLLIDMWAMRVLDNEELARQSEAPLRSGPARTVKISK